MKPKAILAALACATALAGNISFAGEPASAQMAASIRSARILVIGATGNNGGDIVTALDALGARPRLLVRDLAKAQARFPADHDWIVGDITKPETLAPALAGIDIVIDAAATRQMDGPNGVEEVDLGGMRNLIAAGKQAGVKRIVLITGMTVGRPASEWPPMFAKGFKAKRDAELLLIGSGLEYVILRPTGILSRPANKYAIDVLAQNDYKVTEADMRMRPPGTAPDPNGPPPPGTIARADLAEVAIVSAVHRQARNRVFVVTQSQAAASSAWVKRLRKLPQT